MTDMKIGLADKREIFREGLSTLLNLLEPDIKIMYSASTGWEAVEGAFEHQPDVILIDTELYDCSGIEAIQIIHRRLPKVAIIVLTHSEECSDFDSALTAGAIGYISKDTNIRSLIRAIVLAYEGKSVMESVLITKDYTGRMTFESLNNMAGSGEAIHLSAQEKRVISLVAQGLTNRDISAHLSISEHTVKVHLRNAMEKLHAHNRQQAVFLARKVGLLN
jgi:DNA-binding NarL/FixJ family response regulator